MSTATGVVRICTDRGLTLATAESLTAGMLAATLAEVPGCSAVLRGGVIAYSADIKRDVLGVDPALLEHVVSQAVAAQMAQRATILLGADLGLSTTGVAGPDPLDGQPAGTVWIALHDAGRELTRTVGLHLTGDRAEVRHATVAACLELLADHLDGRG